jgi:hypothetical protein
MLPAASVVYIVTLVAGFRSMGWGERHWVYVYCGVTTWAFAAAYWVMLWRRTVKWNSTRVGWTVLAALGAIVAGLFAAVFVNSIENVVGDIIGSIVAPLVWLIETTLLWRETPAERAERLRSLQKAAVVCPSCGYNLTGLQGTRCPECGTLFTLDEILLAQPSRADVDVSD